MTPDPATGLVKVIDLGPTEETKRNDPTWKGEPVELKMFPVDVRETLNHPKAKLKDGSPRFVLAEHYKPSAAADPA